MWTFSSRSRLTHPKASAPKLRFFAAYTLETQALPNLEGHTGPSPPFQPISFYGQDLTGIAKKGVGYGPMGTGLLSNQGEKSINLYFIMVPIRKQVLKYGTPKPRVLPTP